MTDVLTREGTRVNIDSWRVDQEKETPWIITIWEPLTTKVPNPNLASPYCCYISTVIFYVRPYTVRPWHRRWRDGRGILRAEKPGMNYEEWERVDTLLKWDTVVIHGDEEFECGGGHVLWQNKRWWMQRWARRRQKEN